MTSALDHDQLERERDLYQQLLELGTQDEVTPFLEQALSLIVAMTGARRGYIELSEEGSGPEGPGKEPRYWTARDCSALEVAEIRKSLSRGIIGEALATGKIITTSSAREDPRFRDLGSVREHRIEAVLCAPIGAGPMGVLYLHDREPSTPFSKQDKAWAETFTRYLAVFADRLLIRRRRLEDTDPTLPFRAKLRADAVIGRSQALANLLREVSLIAPLEEVGVLLTGASGTGKTQIARVIHESGPRAAKPFLEINCAALPEALFENELFGAVRGGHSGGASEGKVAAAAGGTIFLDEIAELSMGSQAKLLQLLQSKAYFPLGSSKPVRADVRIVAATNVDLQERVAQRQFREDLLSRLESMPIRVPSLAERTEDIVELAVFFCQRACKTLPLRHLTLSAGARYALETAEWPTNIRALENRIRNAAIRAAGEDCAQIERRHVFPEPSAGPERDELTYEAALQRCREKITRAALEAVDWNVSLAAERLDLSRSRVYTLIKSCGIERP